jgi:hypothetical protein
VRAGALGGSRQRRAEGADQQMVARRIPPNSALGEVQRFPRIRHAGSFAIGGRSDAGQVTCAKTLPNGFVAEAAEIVPRSPHHRQHVRRGQEELVVGTVSENGEAVRERPRTRSVDRAGRSRNLGACSGADRPFRINSSTAAGCSGRTGKGAAATGGSLHLRERHTTSVIQTAEWTNSHGQGPVLRLPSPRQKR